MFKFLENIPSIFKNKYLIASLSLLVWMSFFDQYNFIFQSNLSEQKEKLFNEFIQLKNETDKNKRFLKHLNEREFLERYAREQFLMSKPGEDVFILEEKPASASTE